MKPYFFLLLCTAGMAISQDVVRTADPIKRGFQLSDFPRTVKVADNVYTYEDFHSGPEKFTTTNMFVVTKDGVLLADAQGDPEATRNEVEAIAKVTSQPIKDVIICSDHGDHTGGNVSLPAGVTYYIHPNSKAILDRAKPGPWKLPADAKLVTDKTVIHLGGQEFQILFLGRAHTGGDLSVYLPKQKILFLSETFLNRVFPAMRSAYPSEWLKAIDGPKRWTSSSTSRATASPKSPPYRKRSFTNITRRCNTLSTKRRGFIRPAFRLTRR